MSLVIDQRGERGPVKALAVVSISTPRAGGAKWTCRSGSSPSCIHGQEPAWMLHERRRV